MANQHPRLVTVYDKQGKSYVVSHLNAHDMVTHSGYSYKPGRSHSPVDHAPFEVKPVSRASEKKRVQAVLDAVGTDYNGRAEADEDEDDMPAVFDAVATSPALVMTTELPASSDGEPEAAVEIEEDDVEEAPAAAAVDAPKRRGRPAKA